MPTAEGVSCARICQTGLDTDRDPAALNAWHGFFDSYDYSGSYSDCIKSCAKDKTARREYTDQYGNSCSDICENDTEGSFGGSSVEECQGCCASYYQNGAPARLLCSACWAAPPEWPLPPSAPSPCPPSYLHPAALPAPAAGCRLQSLHRLWLLSRCWQRKAGWTGHQTLPAPQPAAGWPCILCVCRCARSVGPLSVHLLYRHARLSEPNCRAPSPLPTQPFSAGVSLMNL